jgi:hypothetical protein
VLVSAAIALAITLLLRDDDDDPSCAIAPTQKHASTREPSCPPLGDIRAAWYVDRTIESRPGNATENRRRPTPAELRRFRTANDVLPPAHLARVTGRFQGATDDIIEWAAWKWGIEEDVLRAQALQESDWRMETRGDAGLSIGLMQIKRTTHPGTFPLSRRSTAFNLDYAGALFRSYYEGEQTWLMKFEHGQPYEAGDVWGSLGAHFAGRWHTPEAEAYVRDVRSVLRERPWRP